MSPISRKTIAAICVFGLPALTVSAPAWSAADLIINVNDSRITPGSCDEASSLVTGRIAIKNAGETAASMKVTERFTRSMLTVYVPESIDMIDKKSETRKLDPFDQEGIAFDIGSGIVKKGRQFGPPLANDLNSDSDSVDLTPDRERVSDIQRALDNIGFNPGTIDGIIGRNTRAAIRSFQESIGAAQTGALTDSQRLTLFDKAGTSTSTGSTDNSYGARGETEVTIYAVVDPYNLVEESNEANNLQVFKFTIDCGQ